MNTLTGFAQFVANEIIGGVPREILEDIEVVGKYDLALLIQSRGNAHICKKKVFQSKGPSTVP